MSDDKPSMNWGTNGPIGRLWDDWSADHVSVKASDAQKLALRKAFYAGVMQFYGEMLEHGEQQNVQELMSMLKDVRNEGLSWMALLREGKV